MCHIVDTNYNHSNFKLQFCGALISSINYLREFLDMPPSKIKSINWKISAAHYLAIKRVEDNKFDEAKKYLHFIESICVQQGVNLSPLYQETTYELDMILEIMKDNNQIRFEFCNAKDDAFINHEIMKLNDALEAIKEYDINSFNEIYEFIDTIFLTKELDNGARFMRSGTNFYMWGAIFICINENYSIPYYIEHIIHECGHTALNILNANDELVNNEADELFDAPLRKDKRPMIGLFHALFILNRICSTFEKILLNLDYIYYDDVKLIYNDRLMKLKNTYRIVKQYGKLTELGKNIINEIEAKWNLRY
ncbi:aKG-HExxH-type peptide beta-hydroxylase [Avibacterium sp. 21-599]|uniref:aKG-HExxH-type peptide beta-hydroxylase n=1 Tax=Avibacterium sp. 21-599 TaxID=2911528 RepID=UPI002247601B|nr:HEXXH motif-containing putative peptide modification protein [Avibacterium sp. 21-599]MCW9718318.1 HEXXH motif-containing putative peptide modification protein [Avibacterium sp. 21-599]